MLPELLDIGVNLAHDSFDADRPAVLARAERAGVRRLLVTGSSIASTRAAIALARAWPQRLRATAGIHPHHATDLDTAALDELRALLSAPEVLAAGECGLDYFRDLSPRAAQRAAFEAQLELAVACGKPVFLHQRDAHEDFTAVLRRFRARLAGGVAHCFTAGLEEARTYVDLDLYIGITGWICDERRGTHLREVVRHIPRERLLIETDAPYLLPRNLQPRPKDRRNEPMYLPAVLETIAECRGESAEALASATTQNAERLFGWKT